jgi:hypothetical protein
MGASRGPMHLELVSSNTARDALLLIMALSYSHEDIGLYIAENSHFCPVSAFYKLILLQY